MDTEPTDPTPTPESAPAPSPGNDNVAAPQVDNAANVAPPAEPPAPEPEPQSTSNPFDFTKEPEPEPAPEDKKPDENAEPYALDLGEAYDGDDATRDMLAGHAKACGLDSAAASKFIMAVASDLARNVQAETAEQDKALQEEWGSNYDANMKATGAYIRERMAAAGIPASEAPALMNATVFRLLNHERTRGNEAPARGTGSTPPMTKQQAYDTFTRDPENRAILFDPSHPRYGEIAAKANALHPLGMQMY